nr:MAG TPA: hypothetical protein [Caudoviricetes sp.]
MFSVYVWLFCRLRTRLLYGTIFNQTNISSIFFHRFSFSTFKQAMYIHARREYLNN